MRSTRTQLLIGCTAAAPPSAAPATAADRDTNYTGVAKGGPVAILVSEDGREVVLAGIGINLKCQSGGGFSIPDVCGKLTVAKSGTFRAAYTNQLVDNGQGRFSSYSGEMHAKFNHARTVVSATWRVHDTERDAAGNATDQCNSGAVKFTAQR